LKEVRCANVSGKDIDVKYNYHHPVFTDKENEAGKERHISQFSQLVSKGARIQPRMHGHQAWTPKPYHSLIHKLSRMPHRAGVIAQ
jgi:hypothetical protein